MAYCVPVLDYYSDMICSYRKNSEILESKCRMYLFRREKIKNYLVSRFLSLPIKDGYGFSLQVAAANQSGRDALEILKSAASKCAEYVSSETLGKKCLGETGAVDLGFEKCLSGNLLPY